ncbi:MAG TPA: hypothetical protein VF581_10615 [Flavobacterium sp.]|jgi:hypothetical protein
MHKFLFLFFLLNVYVSAVAQDSTSVPVADTLKVKKWDASVDVLSRYIWRGQAYGGDFIAVQPAFNYAISDKWSVGVWATTNFKDEYYYRDGDTPNKGYQEFDFGVTYQVNDYLAISVWDYYWPTLHRMEGEEKSYFNYSENGVKTVDATVEFDFSEGYKYPFNGTISTFILGNDYRYNSDGENPKQNFTTYMEIGYTFYDIFKRISASNVVQNINLDPTIGAVVNNQAGYYGAADYSGISFINLALSASREFDLGHGVTMPVSLNYTHNAARNNTETDGRDFLVAGVSIQI